MKGKILTFFPKPEQSKKKRFTTERTVKIMFSL